MQDFFPGWAEKFQRGGACYACGSGSLKEIARLCQVSYPTVRLRLDKLIQKIQLGDQKEEEPFSTFIKGLAVDSRIDLETAKLIIEKYKSEKEKSK